MTVRLATVIKDPRTSRLLHLDRPFERFNAPEGEGFLDGPICRRVAVLDSEPGTGAPSAPVPFRPPGHGGKIGEYAVPDLRDVHSVEMIKTSVFGTVVKTMAMYESEDTL